MKQHVTSPPGSPCKRCGLICSPKTCYVACLEDGETYDQWYARQNDAVRALCELRPIKPQDMSQ